ncbi:DUF4188 domain-containing protein [Halobium salinum]|uniref:DUF4188 domain-containing protein n=1 Tax=Halobium salinum TaxID=1364940 RepID=A0ABD5P9Q8_9EURY|nr:DUF4188 domain-containing protein [Halobium salinum]
MPRINEERLHAAVEDDFVVFIIGVRINRLRAVREWLPVARVMPRMLRELREQPTRGLLDSRSAFGLRNFTMVQYWRSFEDLRTYTRDHDAEYFPAWMRFDHEAAESGAVGISHETYVVRAGEYETAYNNAPEYGLGEVGKLSRLRKGDGVRRVDRG